MLLKDYLTKYRIPITEFAGIAGVDRNTIHNILKGHDFRMRHAEKIMLATNGMVSYEDLVPNTWRAPTIRKRKSKSKNLS